MRIKSSENGDTRESETKTFDNTVDKGIHDPLEGLKNEEVLELLGKLRLEIDELKKKPLTEEEQDKYDATEDYLDEPAVFFCFSYEYAIHADKRRGKTSRPPLDKFIKFKKLYRYGRKSAAGRGVDVVSVSQFTTRSKVEAEWLRDHSLFNFKFFENMDDARSVNTTLSEKLTECASRVGKMSDMQVIERCKTSKMTVHSDLEKLRRELIQTMAHDDLKKRRGKMDKYLSAERDDNDRTIQDSVLLDDDTKGKALREGNGDVY